MNVPEDWLAQLRRVSAEMLPGQLSERFPHPPDDARASAVLMLFGDAAAGPTILFTERSATLRQHARQISFPGGRVDDGDRDAAHTALREANEEVGLEPTSVELLGTLPQIWLPPSNHAVTTVVAHQLEPAALAPVSLAEVATVLTTPVAWLIDPARRYTMRHPSGWRGPAFDIGADVPLWGFTAGIVDRLLDHLGWAVPWDESRTLPFSTTLEVKQP